MVLPSEQKPKFTVSKFSFISTVSNIGKCEYTRAPLKLLSIGIMKMVRNRKTIKGNTLHFLDLFLDPFVKIFRKLLQISPFGKLTHKDLDKV